MTATPWWAIAHTNLRHNSAQQKHTHTHTSGQERWVVLSMTCMALRSRPTRIPEHKGIPHVLGQ